MKQMLTSLEMLLSSMQALQVRLNESKHDQYHVAKIYDVAIDDYRRVSAPDLTVAPVQGPNEARRCACRQIGERMRILVPVLVAILIAGSATLTVAQHQHQHDASAPVAPDSRQFVKLPAPLLEHTLANMRDHLQTLQEIQSHLAMGHTDVAAKIAEERLGMSSLGLHGAAEISKYMPQGMQDAGTTMHHAASRFAVTAQEAGATGDLKPVFAGLAEITAQCVGCHAGYRLK